MFSTFLTSGLLSTLVSGALRLWSQAQDDKRAREAALEKKAGLEAGDRQNARLYVSDGWTKKIIAIAVVGVYVVMKFAPLIAVLLGMTLDVTFSWYEWKNGFWIFSEGKEILKTISVKGIHWTPLDAEILGMIMGYYFGGSLAKRR